LQKRVFLALVPAHSDQDQLRRIAVETVNRTDDIEAGCDLCFEQRWWRIERVCWVVMSTIVLMHVLVATLKGRSERFGRVVDGTTVIVFGKGEWYRDRMRQLRVHEQDGMTSARSQGVERLEQVKYVVFERNGGISVLRDEK
jgi:hypothetical protein